MHASALRCAMQIMARASGIAVWPRRIMMCFAFGVVFFYWDSMVEFSGVQRILVF